MKLFIMLAALLSSSAFAIPVLNRSAPAGKDVMMYID